MSLMCNDWNIHRRVNMIQLLCNYFEGCFTFTCMLHDVFFIKKLKIQYMIYLHTLYKYTTYKIQLNHLPLKYLQTKLLKFKKTDNIIWSQNLLPPLVVKYFCTKSESCTIKNVSVSVSQRKCLRTNLKGWADERTDIQIDGQTMWLLFRTSQFFCEALMT